MKILKRLLIGLVLSLFSLQGFACDSIYLNVIGEKSEVEVRVIRELQKQLINRFEGVTIKTSNLYVFPHLESEEIISPNSLVVDLNQETDMTGSDIKVSIYKSDSQGIISFRGSQRVMTNILTNKKFETLVEIADYGINFNCGVY